MTLWGTQGPAPTNSPLPKGGRRLARHGPGWDSRGRIVPEQERKYSPRAPAQPKNMRLHKRHHTCGEQCRTHAPLPATVSLTLRARRSTSNPDGRWRGPGKVPGGQRKCWGGPLGETGAGTQPRGFGATGVEGFHQSRTPFSLDQGLTLRTWPGLNWGPGPSKARTEVAPVHRSRLSPRRNVCS